MTENLKVIEFECECDFCGAKVANLWPVNAGLYAICRKCYDHIYGVGEEE